MKKHLLIPLLFVSLFFKVTSSSSELNARSGSLPPIEKSRTNLLVEDNKEWATVYGPVIPINLPQQTTQIVYLQGDTIINSISYKKVYESYYKDKSQSSYVGGMRQDEEQVYFVEINHTEEYLLYDFNLSIGDKIEIKGNEAILTDIREQEIEGVIRKIYIFDNSKFDSWIEGIGSYRGVLNSYHWMYAGVKELLLCCHQNGVKLYQNDIYNECFIQNPSSELLSEGTSWTDVHYNTIYSPYWREYEFEIKGDTLIHPHVYWKLYMEDELVAGLHETYDSCVYIRAVHSDENTKWSFYELEKDKDYLLYSFGNWNIGRTIEYLAGDQIQTNIISQINNIILEDNKPYKVVEGIIQTIGSTSGIFSYVVPWPTNGESRLLYEYKRDGKVLYKYKGGSSIENNENASVNIYNLPSGNTVIYIDNPENYNRLQLYNMQGEVVYSTYIHQNKEHFLPDLPKGIYIYELETRNNEKNQYGKLTNIF